MAVKYSTWLPVLALLLVLYARPTHAFGAGNIGSTSKIEGSNWRHGDIEDTLLTLLTARAMGGKKFTKLDVKRTYFGNWLRDYSQAIDVGSVKYVSAEAVRLILWILAFMSFGYGTGEFEVTAQRLGCYRPEEHIDNPKDYADNLDARQYDRRLRGPIDERRELSIDEHNGMKAYIASEDRGITTSAGLVRGLFRKSIELGRRYRKSRDERDYYEALRLLGTGCHCLEDFAAHSNYTELALIELGERDIFPHVGRDTQIRLQGARHPVYPIVTGTFGGVDFLSSVMGEFTDKAAQSELQELEGTIQNSQNADTSLLKDLLDKLPPGILGDSDHKGKADQLQANAQAARMQNMHISPKEPEEFTAQMAEISKQIYPILEFHDNIVKSISEAIDKIPVLPDLIEELQNQVSIFVFSLLAPFIVPVISQVKNELRTGSTEIIQSSRDKQMIVFNDDRSTDPTHSMLSKDHFTNILNEPAGKIGCAILRWVVPQIVAAWDDDSIDIRRTNDRIIHGVMHHPAMREYGDDGARDGRMAMFGVVEQWWGEMDERVRNDMRDKLSRDGVENFRNLKEGVQDTGHGCCKPLGMPTMKTSQSSGAIGGVMGGLNQALGGGSGGKQNSRVSNQISDTVGDAVGGGALGSIVGGVAGALGGGLLGGAFGGNDSEKKTYESSEYRQDGSYNTRLTETGHRPSGSGQQERYGQAQMSQTQYSSGGYREEYQRYEQDGQQGRAGYGFEQTHEVRPTPGGGYEERTERRYEHPGGRYETEYQQQGVTSSGRQYGHQESHSGHKKKDDSDDDDDSGDDDDWERKEKKRRKKEEKRMRKMREEEEERQGGGRRRSRSGSRERKKSKSRSRERRHGDDYVRSSGGYGGGYQPSERRDEYESRDSYGQQEYGRSENRHEQSSYSESRYEQSSSYGGGRSEYQQQSYGGGGDSYGGGRSEYQQQGYGGDSYGGGEYNQRSEYGSSGYGGREEGDAYGGRRDDNEYGSSGGYGGNSGYGGSGYGEQGGHEERRW